MKKILKYFFMKIMMSNTPKVIKDRVFHWSSIYSKMKLDSVKEFDFDKTNQKIQVTENSDVLEKYAIQVLEIPESISSEYQYIIENPIVLKKEDPKLIAYYLTQFHPTEENNKWWGIGTTEWNNVNKAVPQFIGHYQPRLPGELGYYDLRIKENMIRQAELAKSYGISAFCFYYYWFNGKRLLEKPLNMFLENKEINIEFSLCWANENWTRRFDGSSSEILIEVGTTVDSYKEFIHDIGKYMDDPRYVTVNGKKLLLIYKPSQIPKPAEVVSYWREYVKTKCGKELYLIGVDEWAYFFDFEKFGFDAMTEFQPGSSLDKVNKIDLSDLTVRNDFNGFIYDYNQVTQVENKKYHKMYKAVMPMWDNTPRRNHRGVIFHNSSPGFYQKWLERTILDTKSNNQLDENCIFINAWNEWGEGAYLEPDRRFGYAYLNATKCAIENTRGDKLLMNQTPIDKKS